MCHMSHVIYHVSPVTIMPTTTEPHPVNSPTMHSRLVPNEPKLLFYGTKQKNIECPKKGCS